METDIDSYLASDDACARPRPRKAIFCIPAKRSAASALSRFSDAVRQARYGASRTRR